MQQPAGLQQRVPRQYQCPKCAGWNPVPTATDRVACRYCGVSFSWHGDAVQGGRLVHCPLCREPMMYVKKDFPHGWGLAILLAGFVVSTVLWFYFEYIWALAVLVATAAIDALLYVAIGDVTCCYRCGAVFRGFERNEEHGPWDLEIGEKFRHERKQAEAAAAAGDRSASPG